MFIHWLSPGIYFGSPRGFRTDEQNEEIGFNTEVYSTCEVISFLSVYLLSELVLSKYRLLHCNTRDVVSLCIYQSKLNIA